MFYGGYMKKNTLIDSMYLIDIYERFNRTLDALIVKDSAFRDIKNLMMEFMKENKGIKFKNINNINKIIDICYYKGEPKPSKRK
jgi:hypothetical protein